ncbi:hypothetical protein D3C83_112660 [compost metagenome]
MSSVISNSGATRPAAASGPGRTYSGLKKLNTVGERSAACASELCGLVSSVGALTVCGLGIELL